MYWQFTHVLFPAKIQFNTISFYHYVQEENPANIQWSGGTRRNSMGTSCFFSCNLVAVLLLYLERSQMDGKGK